MCVIYCKLNIRFVLYTYIHEQQVAGGGCCTVCKASSFLVLYTILLQLAFDFALRRAAYTRVQIAIGIYDLDLRIHFACTYYTDMYIYIVQHSFILRCSFLYPKKSLRRKTDTVVLALETVRHSRPVHKHRSTARRTTFHIYRGNNKKNGGRRQSRILKLISNQIDIPCIHVFSQKRVEIFWN